MNEDVVIIRVRHHASPTLVAQYERPRSNACWPFTDVLLSNDSNKGDTKTFTVAGRAISLEITNIEWNCLGECVLAEFTIKENLNDSAILPSILRGISQRD